MSSQQILPINNSATVSGQGQKANGIVQTQQPQNSPTSAWVLVDNGMVYINGQVQITPEQIATKISSPNQTSQIECNQNGIANITGNLNMQNNQITNLPDPTQNQEPVTLNYLEQNYQDSSQTQQSIGIAISGLQSVYMPLDEPLDQINPPQNSLDLNYQRIVNLADPQQLNDAVNLEFLQANYETTQQTQQYVGEQISALSTVYMPIGQTLDQIPLAQNNVDLNNNKITNLSPPILSTDGVNAGYLWDNYTDTTNSQQYVNQQIADLSMVYMPIDQTLNNIDLPIDSLDMNNQQIKNMAQATDPNDAVIFSQLDGLLPIATNINGLQAQTANYDTNSYQITVSSPPQQNQDLTNKQYVDGQISSIQNNYVSNSSLAATLQGYYTGSYIDQTFQTISDMVNYVSNNQLTTTLLDYVTLAYLQANYLTSSVISSTYQTISDMSNYYTKTASDNLFATISSLSNYLTISSFNSQISNYVSNTSLTTILLDYVTSAYLQANYLTSSAISSTYQTISDMSNYVNLSYLTSNYYTQTQTDNTFQTQAAMFNYPTFGNLTTELSNYYTIYNANQVFQTIAGMTNYLLVSTAQSTYQTIANMANYLTSTQIANLYQPLIGAINTSNIATYTTEIKSTSAVKTKVSCASNSEILFDVLDVQKMKIYSPVGQATNPTGIDVPDKLQITSGENSMSFSGTKAIQTGQINGSGLYVKTPYSANETLFSQICTQPSSSNCQNLTLSSGQANVPGLGMTQYSVLCNGTGGVQQNLQISASLPNQGDQTLNLYSNSYASSLGQNLTAQFTDKVGYSSAIAITENNQFSSKSYVDSAISALSSVYQTISAFNTAISNYYNKTQSDARYYLNTTTLNNITAPNGNLLMGNGTTNYQIKNVLDPTNSQDVATKFYVDNIGSGISLATGKANFFTLDGTNTVLPSATLNMNTQKISSLANGTLSTDAINLGQADAKYVLKTTELNNLTAPTGNLSLNNQKITNLQSGTATNDGVNFGQLSTINTSLSTFQNIFKAGQVNIGTLQLSTTAVNCVGQSGIITGSTKRTWVSGQSLLNQAITITYNTLSQAPQIYCTLRPAIALNQDGGSAFAVNIIGISTTSATIVFSNFDINTSGGYSRTFLLDCLFIIGL